MQRMMFANEGSGPGKDVRGVAGHKAGGLNSRSDKTITGGCDVSDLTFRTNLIRRLAYLANNSDWEGGPVAWEHRSVVEHEY